MSESASKDALKDLKLTNADLTNLLTELDKAIEGDKGRKAPSEARDGNGNFSEDRTENYENEASQASPEGSINNQ